jgi:hypothetical protein
MAERQTTDLVVSALVMALSRRRPEGDLLRHSDKGSIYTSLESPTVSATSTSRPPSAPPATRSITPPWRASGATPSGRSSSSMAR